MSYEEIKKFIEDNNIEKRVRLRERSTGKFIIALKS